jgi:hypothetical protein
MQTHRAAAGDHVALAGHSPLQYRERNQECPRAVRLLDALETSLPSQDLAAQTPVTRVLCCPEDPVLLKTLVEHFAGAIAASNENNVTFTGSPTRS